MMNAECRMLNEECGMWNVWGSSVLIRSEAAKFRLENICKICEICS